MKVNVQDEDNIMLYINNLYVDKVIFDDKNELERYFKQLFGRLKKFYKINIKGYYNINVHTDSFYGIIISMQRENIDYCDYFGNQVDMRITVEKNNCFLYKINDIFMINKKILDKINILKYKNNFYIKVLKKLDDIEFASIIENSIIIYDNEVNNIILNGKLVVM
jgi:hypothetical protein